MKSEATSNSIIRCSRCRTKVKVKRAESWNATFSEGVIAGYLCPRCQTPDEHLEAEINFATLDYSRIETDALGRACFMNHPWH